MAKRKRGGQQVSAPRTEEDFRPGNSKLAVNSYEDVADSEDEFHLHRDKVLLEDPPQAKRQRDLAKNLVEVSDEEVLGYSDSDASAEDQLEEELDDGDVGSDQYNSGGETQGSIDGKNDELAGWGDSKADYYNADTIQTEEEALAEEQEARRLQQKRRKALTEADFAFDEDDWRAEDGADGADEFQNGVYTETLPQLQITADMTSDDRLELLQTRYPEFEPLSKELIRLQPIHAELSKATQASSEPQPLSTIKLQALSSYLGSLALYFALLSSGSDDAGGRVPLAPHLLREHEIMTTLVRSRENWVKAQELQLPSPPASEGSRRASQDSMGAEDAFDMTSELKPKKVRKARKNDVSTDAALEASLARRAARLRATEASLTSLEAELAASQKRKSAVKSSKKISGDDVDSDIGDEPTLDAYEAAEKARKKRSLRFYTSQIAQKANKRANAGRAAGGDDDLPRRERLRDRQERLLKEAQRRGQEKPDQLGLDSDADEAETNGDREARALGNAGDADDDYASQLLNKVSAKKASKKARDAAYAEAREQGAQVERYVDPTLGPDGRREISYQIQKNKGLTPKRSKDVKNPRVKKRRKFEEKKKKLSSIKPIYKGGEGRGGYGGELTGIKKGIIRSVKL